MCVFLALSVCLSVCLLVCLSVCLLRTWRSYACKLVCRVCFTAREGGANRGVAVHIVSMMCDCIVSTVLVCIFDFLALLFSVMTIIKWHKVRLSLLSFCTSDSSCTRSHDYSMHPWIVTTCHSIVFCMLQIAAGRSFPQKTKQNRHGDIKFLDELAHNQSEFVQVTSRPSQLSIQCDCDTHGLSMAGCVAPNFRSSYCCVQRRLSIFAQLAT